MAILFIAALVFVPLVLLVTDLALNTRREDEVHVPYTQKVHGF